MYTIGQVSKLSGLPISTLRFYDKEGLFPSMERKSGIRQFGETELEALRVIECLKRSGLEIRDIKKFMEWTKLGSKTYEQRLQLFEDRKQVVEAEMAQLQKTLDMLKYKCWYYETALADGSEERLASMIPDGLPDNIRKLYDSAHSDKDSTREDMDS